MAMSAGGISKSKVATIIVAADGTGDTADIQEGINLLPAAGGVVYIKEGTYIITSHITIAISNVAIFGAGASTIIKCNTNNEYILYANGYDKITIRDINFVSDGATRAAMAIVFVNSDDSSIENCWIDGFAIYGIWIIGESDRFFIRANHISNSGVGIKFQANSTIILNNSITGCSDGIGLICSVNGSVVQGNYCYSNTSHGINYRGGNAVTITGNNCRGNTGAGIYLHYVRYSNISSNVCYDNDSDGIKLFYEVLDCLFGNNNCSQNTGYGINIADATCDGNFIHGLLAYGNSVDPIHNLGDENTLRDYTYNRIVGG